jgi:hypothetical protein
MSGVWSINSKIAHYSIINPPILHFTCKIEVLNIHSRSPLVRAAYFVIDPSKIDIEIR